MNKKLLFYIWILLALCACEDVIEPNIDNRRQLESGRTDPAFGIGILYNGYTRLPNGRSFSEMATDDAVSNDESNAFSLIANGRWAENFNPVGEWQRSRSAIQYLNLMFSEVDSITFADNPVVNRMFRDRTKGEAYGLRAIHMYHLLKAHGGMADGQLLGIPILLEPEDSNSDYNKERATFEECMVQLYSDIDKAIELLPLDYGDISDDSQIPDKYLEMGADKNGYDRVFGNAVRLRITARIARGIRARAALLAASPAFDKGTNTTTWEDAANYAAEVIDLNGGISGIDPDGVTWYNNTGIIDDLASGANPGEILWRGNVSDNTSDLESMNYPPSLFGEGLINPTQNFVDAFPAANGYPIGHPDANYNAASPYENRDPRLQHFVIVNGSTAGPNDATILTSVDGGTKDGLNNVETSTRTGYYLRKLLRQDVNLDPVSPNGQRHITPLIRYTEIYLIYAEAANEAWGPLATGGHTYSAYDVIKAIRARAGIGVDNGDAYLESIKGDQAAMRELIRNERRLELSFEGFRFWDLRRWDENLTETAEGVKIQNGNHEIIDVEPRIYSDYMIYGPIPYSETLKFSALQQNTGW